MAKIITGFAYDIGRRDVYEDRYVVAQLKTQSGIPMQIGIVSDGVGGEEHGQRAAQLVIDVITQQIELSNEKDVPEVLICAIEEANREIYREAQKRRADRMAATVAIAAIVPIKAEGLRLFIASVGDSRIYIIRQGKLTQLTIDHNYANLKHWPDEIKHAIPNAREEMLIRAMGIAPGVKPDIGFYVGTTNPDEAEERGWGGLPLEKGDSVLICSDGLIKNAIEGFHEGKPLASDDEIIRVLSSKEGDNAAKTLVSFASGRKGDDNITAVVLQMPDPNRRRLELWYRYRLVGAGAIVSLIVLLIAGAIMLQSNQQVNQAENQVADMAAQFAQQTQAALDLTQTAVIELSFTPTASPSPTATLTPFPTVAPGAIGFRSDNISIKAGAENRVQAMSPLLLGINHDQRPDSDRASIYVRPATNVQFEEIAANRVKAILFPGSNLFAITGTYDTVKFQLAGNPAITVMVGRDALPGVMNIDYSQSGIVAIRCYWGTCSYSTEFEANPQPISEHGLTTFNLADLNTPAQTVALTIDQLRLDYDFLSQMGGGRSGKRLPVRDDPLTNPAAGS